MIEWIGTNLIGLITAVASIIAAITSLQLRRDQRAATHERMIPNIYARRRGKFGEWAWVTVEVHTKEHGVVIHSVKMNNGASVLPFPFHEIATYGIKAIHTKTDFSQAGKEFGPLRPIYPGKTEQISFWYHLSAPRKFSMFAIRRSKRSNSPSMRVTFSAMDASSRRTSALVSIDQIA
ncbi:MULTISPECIES: hypothetical protein [unclassified Brucella]|uniref:hypothetical protein n=1 Tax=unclassified Brucella TaxID=2632610 RepID=UPI000972ADBE|nr:MULTISPECIES: hypothetical protein [unclassified Brucella]APY12982.1 hypothetical protein BKD02_00505 [Brucella sp. 09RB8910]MRN47076.1 hypothetical protein [Brucella sp. 10RB9212]MRN66568.1 hypothetical protein [Brucella sp. 10RB9213]